MYSYADREMSRNKHATGRQSGSKCKSSDNSPILEDMDV